MIAPLIDSVPPGLYVPHADHRVDMFSVGWEAYETMLRIRGEKGQPRISYLDGNVELMTASRDHEYITWQLGQVVVQFCVLRGIICCALGQWTLSRQTVEAGCEPDTCFAFTKRSGIGDRPDLVIEVIWTSGGINKLEIYRRLGVKEVWFWDVGEIAVYVLEADRYEKRTRSACLPELDLALACRLAALESQNELIEEARKAFAP